MKVNRKISSYNSGSSKKNNFPNEEKDILSLKVGYKAI